MHSPDSRYVLTSQSGLVAEDVLLSDIAIVSFVPFAVSFCDLYSSSSLVNILLGRVQMFAGTDDVDCFQFDGHGPTSRKPTYDKVSMYFESKGTYIAAIPEAFEFLVTR